MVLHDLKHLRKGIVEGMMGILRRHLDRGFTVALFQRRGGEREALLEQVKLHFSFRNKYIIILPWGHQVDNNTFFNMRI
jgi:hypothetical protein